MMEEVDEEEFMNRTINRTINTLDAEDEHILETTQEYHQEVWINKTNMATELAMVENLKKKTLPLEEMIPKEFHEYLDIFNEQKANRLPMSQPWDHWIEMKEGFKPKSFKNYSLTPQEQIEMEKFLKENLEKGYIQPSKSPMASPFFFVDKKDGKLWPTQDYRYLNEWMIKNAYPLPLISDVIDKLQGSRYFTKLDIRWGYNNVRIKEEDEWKAAFKTNKGLFEPTIMFFRLCNSPATFQNMMDHTFSDMITQGFLIIYMDNLLIHAKTKEDLKQYTKQVLQQLQENDMYCKPQKCEFKKEQTKYLGMVISHNSVLMDPTKLTGIKNWPTLTTIRQVWSFLGFGNYYWRFIKKFAHLARPLNNLLKKDAVFEWTKECQTSFDLLKKWFSKEPVLMMPDQTKPFQIKTNASKYASGAILTQTDMNGNWHPIAFLSKTFTETERNYDIYDRELLAIIRALTEWRHYIQGSGHTTEVLSDHMNLMYFKSAQKLNWRQAWWALLLLEYDLKLWHVPGHQMTQADALSRRSDHYQKEDHDNKNMVLLPDNLFINLLDTELQDQILGACDIDHNVSEALDQLLNSNISDLSKDLDDWKVKKTDKGNTIFYQEQNYIPKDYELWRDIVRMNHNHETAGHLGELETYNAIKSQYWWPGLQTFVKNYVKGCAICQQFKIDQHPSHPAYIPTEGAQTTRPFANCSMDMITNLPMVNGLDSLLVIVDQGLTKGVILIPCSKTVTAEQVATLLLDNLYKQFRLPNKIISDRGPQFAFKSFREWLKLLGIKSALSMAYHPQTDATMERVNQEIKAYLSIYCSSHPEDWPNVISILEFTHNNRWHANWLQTPLELLYGESPIAIPTTFTHTKYPSIEEKIKRMIKDREEALAAHKLARRRIAERRNNMFIPFKQGQRCG